MNQKVYVAHVDLPLKGQLRGGLPVGIRKNIFPRSTCKKGTLDENVLYNTKTTVPIMEAETMHTYHTILMIVAVLQLVCGVHQTPI